MSLSRNSFSWKHIYTSVQMSVSNIDRYLTPGLREELVKWLRVFQVSLFSLVLIPLFLLSLLIVSVYRAALKIIYKYYHNGKYRLPKSTDAAFSLEYHANTVNINNFMFIKGQTDIHRLRDLWLNRIINHEKADGRRPYEKYKWRMIEKYGFFTWEDCSDQFDIREHVKYCPGVDQSHIVYLQEDVVEAVGKRADDVISADKPKWEVLFVPKVKMNEDGDLHYALIFRVHHGYMDGISVMLMLQKLLDSEAKLTLDPIRPPMRTPTTLEKIGLYLQVLLFGPYTLYKSTRLEEDNVFQQMKENKGPKFFGCTKMEMSMEDVKKIRKTFNCSTTAIFNSVITGALRRAAERKGLPIPEAVNFGFSLALVPYPNDEPQNRFTIVTMRSPISISDPVKRLARLNAEMKTLAPHEVTTLYWVGKCLGLFPVWVNELAMQQLHSGYVLTNLPGLTETGYVDGNPIKETYGTPPIKNGIGFAIGVSSYAGKLRACWLAEKTEIISDRNDMNSLMEDYEKEFSALKSLATPRKNNN